MAARLMRLFSFSCFTVLCITLGLLHAQSQAVPTLSFEAASIHPNYSGGRSSNTSINSSGRFSATNVTAKILLIAAYKLQAYQIIGGPAWMDSDRFDIAAKAEDKANAEQVAEMIQSLLADRFKMTFHHETRELPVYALVVAKNGSKLKASPGGDNHDSNTLRGKITGSNIPLETLVVLLSNQLDRLVVDRTRLTGYFDLLLEWSPDASRPSADAGGGAATEPSGPSIFTAVQEQLGLHLEATKALVDAIVIDAIERPSEN
jgi:uncharacterized protein (TIGR03435 family)